MFYRKLDYLAQDDKSKPDNELREEEATPESYLNHFKESQSG